MSGDKVIQLSERRGQLDQATHDEIVNSLNQLLAEHYRSQKVLLEAKVGELLSANAALSAKVDRLMAGTSRLLEEMNGVRTGTKDEAFAKVIGDDGGADLPKIQADQAIFYPYTSEDIGSVLGFSATEIGQLLGQMGLRWAGNGEYQEMSRWKIGRTRFWHRDVPERLKIILSEKTADELGIQNSVVRSMFERYQARMAVT